MTTTIQYISMVALWGALLCMPYSALAREGQQEDKQSHTGTREGSLSPEQREKAEQIITEARPRLEKIRQEMREKMQELKALNYNNQTDSQDLARLGRQLQEQRNALMQELQTLDQRLQNEVGGDARMRGFHGRGCAALVEAAPCQSPQAGPQPSAP